MVMLWVERLSDYICVMLVLGATLAISPGSTTRLALIRPRIDHRYIYIKYTKESRPSVDGFSRSIQHLLEKLPGPNQTPFFDK